MVVWYKFYTYVTLYVSKVIKNTFRSVCYVLYL